MVKRVFYSLRFYKKRNGLLVLLFGCLFCLLFLALAVSISAGHQVAQMRDTVGSSVVVQKKLVGSFYGTIGTFYENEKEELTVHPLVRDYNLVTTIGAGNWEGVEPYYSDEEAFENYRKELEEAFADRVTSYGFFDQSSFFGVTNSEDYALFAGGGYKIVEGKPITKEDMDKHVALISEAVAEKNGLHVGDTITVRSSDSIGKLQFAEAVTVQGIFSYPESEEQQKLGTRHLWQHPANYTFLPEEFLTELDRSAYPIEQIFVYLKDIDQLDIYIQDMKAALGEMFTDRAQGEFRYDYYWDGNWYEQISVPFAQLSQVAAVMAILLSVGVLLILLLICAWLFRGKRRGLGVLFSMGEGKGKIAGQVLLEELLPLLLAAFLGAGAAWMLAEPVSRKVLDQSAGPAINLQLEGQRDQVNRYESSGTFELRNDFLGEHFTVYRAPEKLYFSDSLGTIAVYALAGLVFLAVSMVLQVWIMLRESPAKILIAGES